VTRDAPSVRERNLARELRTLRRSVDLAGNQVAMRLGWSTSKISRIENGRIGVSAEDLELLLRLYEVPDERAAYLRRLADSVRGKGWWDAYRDSLDPGYSSLVKLERGSSTLRSFCVLVPHALLMTREFAQRVITLAQPKPARPEVDRRLDIVRRRQEVLRATDGHEPLRLSMILDESFLHRRVLMGGTEDAGREVMRGQLERLLVEAERPNVTVRLLPFSVGLPSVTAGSFSILGSAAGAAPDVVYLENKSRIFFIDAEAEVESYVQDFELMNSWALTPEQTAAALRRRADELGE
jgi:transcriptional regulator with XRE-family HTH domain